MVVTTEGKQSALEAGVLSSLEPLVGDTCSEVRFNAVKVLGREWGSGGRDGMSACVREEHTMLLCDSLRGSKRQ